MLESIKLKSLPVSDKSFKRGNVKESVVNVRNVENWLIKFISSIICFILKSSVFFFFMTLWVEKISDHEKMRFLFASSFMTGSTVAGNDFLHSTSVEG